MPVNRKNTFSPCRALFTQLHEMSARAAPTKPTLVTLILPLYHLLLCQDEQGVLERRPCHGAMGCCCHTSPLTLRQLNN